MSEVTILSLRKKALKERGLADGMSRVVEEAWQRHSPASRHPVRSAACLWIDDLSKLSVHVCVPPDAATVLRPYGFGLIRETIRPLWRASKDQRGAFVLTECGFAIVDAANRWLCDRYAYSSLGVWHALMSGSSNPPAFTADEQELPVSALKQTHFLGNQLRWLERAAPSPGK